MIKPIAIFTIICFILFPISAWSNDPVFSSKIKLPNVSLVEGETDVGAAISPLRKGIRAPFSGLLLSPLAVATLMSEISSYQALLELELARVKGEYEADLQFKLNKLRIELEADKAILQTQLDARKFEIIELNDQLEKEINNRPNVVLWLTLGIAGGISLTLLTLFATNQMSN